MITVDEALSRILTETACPTGSERLPLPRALNRTLAEDVRAPFDVPPADNTAMDGYALRAADAHLLLPISQRIPAGVVGEPLAAGTAARIFTGAQAQQLHLVDTLGYLDDAVATARSMGGVGQARVVLYHRCNDRARTPYSITPNVPLQGNVVQMNSPGLDRASMPTFLYLWEPEPTMERLGGR